MRNLIPVASMVAGVIAVALAGCSSSPPNPDAMPGRSLSTAVQRVPQGVAVVEYDLGSQLGVSNGQGSFADLNDWYVISSCIDAQDQVALGVIETRYVTQQIRTGVKNGAYKDALGERCAA